MDNNPYNLMDPSYSSSSSRLRRAMIGNVPGLETAICSYQTTERGYCNTIVERPTVDPYSPHYELIKFLKSNYPSSIDPRTPLKVNFEEGTLVLDAIPAVSSFRGSSLGKNHSRSSYLFGEDTGSKSRSPHSQSSCGKEERRVSHVSPKNNYPMSLIREAKTLEDLKDASSPTSKSAQVITHAPSSAILRSSPKIPSNMILSPPRSDLVPKKTPSSNALVLSSDWSPIDDGIMVNLPSNPSNPPVRAEVNFHFQKVLYSSSTWKRLPVFEEIYGL